MKISHDDYYYREHSRQELEDWHQRLRFFSYRRAIGGHANDGDELRAIIRFRDDAQLIAILSLLGVPIKQHAVAPPKAAVGKSYSAAEWDQLVSCVPTTRWIEQPGHCVVAGQRVLIWGDDDSIKITVADGYDVTEACVESAIAIEPLLETLPAGVVQKAEPLPPWPWTE